MDTDAMALAAQEQLQRTIVTSRITIEPWPTLTTIEPMSRAVTPFERQQAKDADLGFDSDTDNEGSLCI